MLAQPQQTRKQLSISPKPAGSLGLELELEGLQSSGGSGRRQLRGLPHSEFDLSQGKRRLSDSPFGRQLRGRSSLSPPRRRLQQAFQLQRETVAGFEPSVFEL